MAHTFFYVVWAARGQSSSTDMYMYVESPWSLSPNVRSLWKSKVESANSRSLKDIFTTGRRTVWTANRFCDHSDRRDVVESPPNNSVERNVSRCGAAMEGEPGGVRDSWLGGSLWSTGPKEGEGEGKGKSRKTRTKNALLTGILLAVEWSCRELAC